MSPTRFLCATELVKHARSSSTITINNKLQQLINTQSITSRALISSQELLSTTYAQKHSNAKKHAQEQQTETYTHTCFPG